MQYDKIPVIRRGDYGNVIGVATVVVNDDNSSDITIHTVTPDFNEFLKQGNLKSLDLSAMVVAPISRKEKTDVGNT